MPKLISNNERPKDHKSLATEYWDPWKKEKYQPVELKNISELNPRFDRLQQSGKIYVHM